MTDKFKLKSPKLPSHIDFKRIRLCGMSPLAFIRASIENRARFLAEQRAKFESSSSIKRNEQIVELLRLTLSHMETGWIAAEVARWRQDFDKYHDHLNRAFGGKPLDYLSPKGKKARKETAALSLRIDVEVFISEISRKQAIKDFVINSEDDKLPEQAETALKKRVQRFKKDMKNPHLPLPYFGKEVIKRANSIDIYAPLGSGAAFNGYTDNFKNQVSRTPVVIESEDPIMNIPMPREFGPNGEMFDMIIKSKWPEAF